VLHYVPAVERVTLVLNQLSAEIAVFCGGFNLDLILLGIQVQNATSLLPLETSAATKDENGFF